jgi:hypothetical protein
MSVIKHHPDEVSAERSDAEDLFACRGAGRGDDSLGGGAQFDADSGRASVPAFAPTATRAFAPEQETFHACVLREAKAIFGRQVGAATHADEAVRDAILYGYHTAINNEVIAACKPGLAPETMGTEDATSDPD